MKINKFGISLAAGMLALSAFGMTPVFAEDPQPGKPGPVYPYHIIVKNTPKAGATYTAYLVFDETDKGGAVAYTIEGDSEFYDVVSTYDGIKLTKAAGSTDTYIVEKTSTFDAPTFAAKLLADPTKPTSSGRAGSKARSVTTKNGEDADIGVFYDGYYLVDSATGTLASLGTTTEGDFSNTVTVVDKSRDIFTDDDDGDGHLNFYTEADDHAIESSEVVNYTIHSVIPATVGYDNYTYTIAVTDNGGIGLDKDSIKIAYDGAAASATVAGFTVDKTSDTGFTVTIDAKTLNGATGQDALGKKFTITYSGKVNVEKMHAASAAAETVLTHSTDPGDTSKTETHNSEDKIYGGLIQLSKLDGAKSTKDNPVYLAGAQFVLANADGTKFYKKDTATGAVTWVAADDAEKAVESGATVFTSKAAYSSINIGFLEMADTDHPTDPSKLVGNADDARGKYKLYEIKAPDGYNRLSDPVDVSIEYNNGQSSTAFVDVDNFAGTEMPKSGGAGTAAIYMIGTLVAASGVLYVVSKRKKEQAAQ